MMNNCLVPNIPARSRDARWSNARRLIALAALATLGVSAQSLETLAASYRKTPNVSTRTALVRFAKAHPADQNGALALLVLGQTEAEQRQFGDAAQDLKEAGKRLPKLADYAAYSEAAAEFEQRDYSKTESSLAPVWKSTPVSPLEAKAVALQANSYIQNGEHQKAIAFIQHHLSDLAESQAEVLLARAYDAGGDSAAAIAHYQKIYVEFPLSKEAFDAQAALARYPEPEPRAMLTRALKLIDGGDYARARKELTPLLVHLNGADLDLARVRIGATWSLVRDYKQAFEHLNSFQVSTPESEAERLYYLEESARHLGKLDEMNAALERLSDAHRSSGWRFQAMVAVANYYSGHNQTDKSEPLYRACYEGFPNDPRSAQCHWKIAWSEYLRDPSRTAGMFREHLKLYPDSDHVSAALYFLGRIEESKSDWGAARMDYEAVVGSYPNAYYSLLAHERLAAPNILAAARSQAEAQFLSSLSLPKTERAESFVATDTTQQRIERAHLLASAGLQDLAEGELRFGAKADGQPQLMAVELADLANRRDAPDQAIRYIKRFAPGYMSLALDTAPEKFWQLAFPMPYRKSLEEYCRAHSLDPYLMAALIRQESEFNPKAVSPANARGLTQVMPATGRELSRKLKLRRYSTSMLYTPETNLQIGTYYLKALADQLNGKWEEALASYNAGKARVNSWLGSANFREPAEFVESIPFAETKLYVQNILRNAEIYRRVYGQKR